MPFVFGDRETISFPFRRLNKENELIPCVWGDRGTNSFPFRRLDKENESNRALVC